MAPTPTYDFVVVGGFHAPDDHAKSHPIAAANASFLNEQDSERLTASVTSALKSAGGGRNLVRRTDGRNADDRSLLADVLEAAVRDGGEMETLSRKALGRWFSWVSAREAVPNATSSLATSA